MEANGKPTVDTRFRARMLDLLTCNQGSIILRRAVRGVFLPLLISGVSLLSCTICLSLMGTLHDYLFSLNV